MHIQIESLSHIFNGNTPRAALQDVSVDIASGEFVAVIGPSGCGKSTFIRLIAHLLIPTRGRILLDGRAPELAAENREIAWMAQSPALLPWRTVLSNVELATYFRTAKAGKEMTPEEVLALVGLGDVLTAYPDMLSGGMQQRLALARTLMLGARLWLMDEPFASLDEITREHLTHELLELWQLQKPTVLWITHHVQEALRLADRVLVFSPSPGRIVQDLRVDLARPRREAAPAFIETLGILRQMLRGEIVKESQ